MIRKVSLGHKVAQTAYKLNQELSKELKDFDIAPEQRVILEVVSKNSKISQNELSQYLEKDKTTVSRTLDVIEKKGYITRKYIKEDKRIKYITLTTLGEEILENTKGIITEFRESTMKNFTEDEIESIFDFMDRLSANIECKINEK